MKRNVSDKSNDMSKKMITDRLKSVRCKVQGAKCKRTEVGGKSGKGRGCGRRGGNMGPEDFWLA